MRALAEALEDVRKTRSRIVKEERLARYLVSLDEATLPHAARMLAGRVVPVDDPRPPGAGYAVWRAAASAATGWDLETISDCMRATSDGGEAIGLLVAADPHSHARPGLSVLDVVALAGRIAAVGSPSRKIALLADALQKMPPVGAKYLVKLMSGGLRIGALQGVLEGAIARAWNVDQDDVRRAIARCADIGEVAVLARAGHLENARVHVGRPIGFMLATPIQSVAQRPSGEGWVIEDKLDGVRAQVHRAPGMVRIFARSGDVIDGTFPEIEDALRWCEGTFVMDGEVIAVGPDGVIAPFAALQERLNRKRVGERERTERPVVFVAFDLLVDGDRTILDEPWSVRRAMLEARVATLGTARERVRLSGVTPLAGDDLEDLRRLSLERGAEGLMLKRADAIYDAGRRGQSWVKVKEAYATLDVVVTAAEEGHGKRRGMLSDYTFAVWRGAELLNVGKAYSGLTDEEIEALTVRLQRMTTARYGRVRSVRPELVIEVAFDSIHRSTRHRSGYALRFPRIVRIRDDKSALQANTIDDVRALFERQGAARAKKD
jgi:DNA ligase-1